MNSVLGYSLALLLAGGGPAATTAATKPELKILATAASPAAAIASPSSKPVAATSPALTVKPLAVSPTGSSRSPLRTPPAVAAPGSAKPPTPLTKPVPQAVSLDRPAWVGEADGPREGRVYVMHVYVGPELSRTDCEQKLKVEIERRLIEYAASYMPYGAPLAVPFDIARLRPRIVTQEWEERIGGATADLVYLHVQLRIDENLRQEWEKQGVTVLRAERSRIVMLGYAGAVVAAAAAFALLKWSSARSAVLPSVTVVAIIVGAVAMAKLFLSA